MQKIEKPWGFEEIIETNEIYTVKKLFMMAGYQCSYQYHQFKKETVTVLSGSLHLILEENELILNPFDTVTIRPMQKHRMKAVETDCLYMESSTSELDDVIRIQDDYGR